MEPREFDWGALTPRVIHPMKVEIIEAMAWIGQPLSASELREVFCQPFSISRVSYHLKELARHGVVEKTGECPVRGALQVFYFFPPG